MKKMSAGFFENRINVFLFLFIPTVALYAKSLAFGFTPLDEKWLIIDNAEYLKLWRSLTDAFTSSLYRLYYRPLLAVSIFIDYKISGLSTYLYHVTNLVWHLISVFCLFRLLTLFDVQRKTSAFLTLAFALHPIALHAVAWVPGRNDLMLCAFALGSLIFLKKYLIHPKAIFLGLHFFLFACALFTKENAISLPLVFFIMAYGKSERKHLYLLTGLWLTLAGLWLLLRNAYVPGLPGSVLGFNGRIIHFFSGFLTYFGKSVFPVNQSVHPTFSLASVIIGLVSMVLILFLFFKPGISNLKTAFTGLVLFTILLVLPLWFSSGRSNPDFYEHRSYTSTCGLILFLSQVRFKFNTKVFYTIISVILVLFFIKSSLRMNFYKNEENFLAEAIKEQPGYFLFQVQYAEILAGKGDYSSSIDYYDKAISLRPDKHEYYNSRGRAHFMLGNFSEAIKDISNAIKIAGFDTDYYLNRCMVYNEANEVENAMKDLYVLMNCCREIVPEELKNDVGLKWRNKLKEISAQLVAEPGNHKLFYRRASMYFDTGQKEKGFADLQKAMELAPGNREYKKLYSENIRR